MDEDPLVHYIRHGRALGRKPNALFDPEWYRLRYPEVAAFQRDPLLHYLEEGAAKGFDPSPHFHTRFYRAHYPDVALAGLNPLAFAMDESVGGVGARLLYPDGRIQHAGMPAGVMGPCTHAFIGLPGTAPTYQDWAVVQREWSLVTGAVFATRRSVLEQANGMDERFSLDFNDVDLCFRLRLLGYRIVYTPYAELTHFESASHGRRRIPADQTALFMEKWQDYLKDDPAYHPNLTRTTPNIHAVVPEQAWWSAIADGTTGTGAGARGL